MERSLNGEMEFNWWNKIQARACPTLCNVMSGHVWSQHEMEYKLSGWVAVSKGAVKKNPVNLNDTKNDTK